MYLAKISKYYFKTITSDKHKKLKFAFLHVY